MYDPKRQRLGIMATDPDEANNYPFSAFSGCQISCGKLFEYYGIEITETRRYHDSEVVDGVLVVNFDGGSEKAPNAGRRSMWG